MKPHSQGPLSAKSSYSPPRRQEDISILASRSDGGIGAAKIEAPRNGMWLAVFPAAVIADAVLIMPALIAGGVLYAFGQQDTPTTWTWTP
jgi:hypothetical protein